MGPNLAGMFIAVGEPLQKLCFIVPIGN
jgi:hypothetical protein